MKELVFGWTPSQMDGNEQVFEVSEGLEIPEEYDYTEFLPRVYNQGALPICVTCSVGVHLNWNINVDTSTDNTVDSGIRLMDIYRARTNQGDGMTFKEALAFLRHTGVESNRGLLKIERYALVHGIEALKAALILNGPCVGAFLVRNMTEHFWNPRNGNENFGGHAISICGYNKEGFIIRNSWGEEWGNNGCTILPYSQFGYLLEVWTIID